MQKLKMNLQMFGATTPVDPTTSNTHVSENFGKLLYPGLRKIFFETYDEIPEQFPKYSTYKLLLLQLKQTTEWEHLVIGKKEHQKLAQ